MDSSWSNTRDALRNFADILTCGKCGSEPVAAVRFSNCGHFFCKQCVINNSNCLMCKTPVRPTEVCPDIMIADLVQCCKIVASVIQEGNLWSTNTHMHNVSQVSKVLSQSSSKVNKKSNFIPKNFGKNINKRNPKGETPLHTACLKGQEVHVKALLAAGANPNTKDNAGWTPLVIQMTNPHKRIPLSLYNIARLAQEVVNYGRISLCRLLLEAGAAPNVPGVDNKTALHEAAIQNRLEEAKLLLQYNAKSDVYDQYGKRPIDYCISDAMRDLLEDKSNPLDTSVTAVDLSCTLNQSFCIAQSKYVVFPLNLREENLKLLSVMVAKHKMSVTSSFKSSVTHVILEVNAQNTINLSYTIMMAILRGCWLLNSDCISLGIDLEDISDLDLELFEVSGAPFPGVPKKARENAQSQNPGLFNRCYFYFALQAKSVYQIGEVQLTKDSLSKLITEGGGSVLTREPDPEDIKDVGKLIPFHTAHDLSHPLYRCTHYIIYAPQKDEPRIKYNMPHIKTLPLMWLIECIEKFTLVNPSYLGL